MIKRFKPLFSRFSADETGQALIIVLVMLVLGSLTLVPVMHHIGTALKTGGKYEVKTGSYYAADAGVEDAIWRVKYDCIDYNCTGPAYSPYDFSTNWTYQLTDSVNGLAANVSIRNVWIPKYLNPPTDPVATEEIIKKNKLVVAGTSTTSNVTLIISFYPEAGDNLTVESIGVWLPCGFTYVPGSSNLESDPYYCTPGESEHAGGEALVWELFSLPFTSLPGVAPQDEIHVTEITFGYTADVPGTRPATISWLETVDYVWINDILPVTWDIDTSIFKINSIAGGAEVEAYSSRNELRKMVDAIGGDYRAVGNTLIVDTGTDGKRDDWLNPVTKESSITVDDIPNSEDDGYADVIEARLYWSAWINESGKETIAFYDCSDSDNWTLGSCWSPVSGEFLGTDSDGGDGAKLTLTYSLDLHSYDEGTVMVSWEQREWKNLEGGDGLDFAFSGNGGTDWSERIEAFRGNSPPDAGYLIPKQYLTSNFKLQFYLVGCNEQQENVYIDNIRIAEMVPDDTATFKIAPPPYYSPEQTEAITASRTQVLPNFNSDGSPNGFSYSGYADVTNLVETYAEVIEDAYHNFYHTGNAKYTVGDVDAVPNNDSWAYAGWSLVIIYSSPKTAGHQLYLYDDFSYADEDTDVDFDGDGEMGGTISGFIVPEPIEGEVDAAAITCFVGEGDLGSLSWGDDFLAFNAPEIYRTDPWSIPNSYKLWDGMTCTNNNDSAPNNVWNNKSIGLTADGVDIDTFNITWASGLLQPGDTSAHIDLPTESDSWNLVYIILSFRSETVTGGTSHYVIYN